VTLYSQSISRSLSPLARDVIQALCTLCTCTH